MELTDVGNIVKGVNGATNLTALSLDGCDIDANGAMIFATVIKAHPALELLSIQADPYKRPFVRIGCVGAVAIARALEFPTAKVSAVVQSLVPPPHLVTV